MDCLMLQTSEFVPSALWRYLFARVRNKYALGRKGIFFCCLTFFSYLCMSFVLSLEFIWLV